MVISLQDRIQLITEQCCLFDSKRLREQIVYSERKCIVHKVYFLSAELRDCYVKTCTSVFFKSLYCIYALFTNFYAFEG